MMKDPYLNYLKNRPIEQERYLTLKETLSSISDVFSGKRVLDFGASYGLTTCILLRLGARYRTGEASRRAR